MKLVFVISLVVVLTEAAVLESIAKAVGIDFNRLDRADQQTLASAADAAVNGQFMVAKGLLDKTELSDSSKAAIQLYVIRNMFTLRKQFNDERNLDNGVAAAGNANPNPAVVVVPNNRQQRDVAAASASAAAAAERSEDKLQMIRDIFASAEAQKRMRELYSNFTRQTEQQGRDWLRLNPEALKGLQTAIDRNRAVLDELQKAVDKRDISGAQLSTIIGILPPIVKP